MTSRAESLRNLIDGLEEEKLQTIIAETKMCAVIAKRIGETFLLDMTAMPNHMTPSTWARMETIRHIVEALERRSNV